MQPQQNPRSLSTVLIRSSVGDIVPALRALADKLAQPGALERSLAPGPDGKRMIGATMIVGSDPNDYAMITIVTEAET
jgi:hypothetical protein